MTFHQKKKSSGEQKTSSIKIDVKTVQKDGSFEGYGSVFGVVDAHKEIVVAGAYLSSLAKHKSEGTLPAMLWQHNTDEPIGTYTEMKEDGTGLWVKGQLELETQKGREAYALLKSGALSGMSIGYRVLSAGPRDEETYVRELKELDLWEVSLVTFPSNEASRVSGVKREEKFEGIETLRDCEAFLRDEGGMSQLEAKGILSLIKRLTIDQRDAEAGLSSVKTSQERLLKLLKD